ncbi:efflux RND transporter periplasmic adaptor subunit [Chitinimonas sp.]|uniref:efflux RND transporter periplasmic adaptor subunit n=1 Tax=Chitinimonas sp. TaxID=1934313 RepID=UPI0035B39BF4
MRLPFKKKWLGLVLAIAVIGLPLFAKSRSSGDAKPVDMQAAAMQDIRPTILASGTLAYRDEVNLRSEVTARVAEILIEEGSDVKAGQLLMRLDPVSYRNAIEREQASRRQAEVGIEQLRATLELRRSQFERTRKLFEAKMVDQSKFDLDRNQLQVAEVDLRANQEALKRADAILKEAREQLGKTEIRAPIAGRVVSLPIKVGETAIPSISAQAGAQLLTLADTSAIQAELKVDEGDIAKVNLAQPVNIYPAAYPDTPLKGKVEKVALSSSGDATGSQSRNYKVTVSLNPDPTLKLRSGMSARAEILLGDGNKRLAVPVEAVISEEDESSKQTRRFIAVAREGKTHRQPVKVGISDDRWQEVLDGIKVGDTVIVGPGKTLNDLKEGDAVRAQKPEEKAKHSDKKDKKA